MEPKRNRCMSTIGIRWSDMSPTQQRDARRVWRMESYYRNHERSKARQRKDKQGLRRMVFEGGGIAPVCERCGYDKCLAALDFHHKDPKEKRFIVMGGGRPLHMRIEEARKCIVLCSNCHRELHSAGEVFVCVGRPGPNGRHAPSHPPDDVLLF